MRGRGYRRQGLPEAALRRVLDNLEAQIIFNYCLESRFRRRDDISNQLFVIQNKVGLVIDIRMLRLYACLFEKLLSEK